MSTTKTEFRGPPKTNPGGKWYVKDHTAVGKDTGSVLCAICMCDCSVCCIMCFPLKTEYVYQDPVTNKLVGEDGIMHPAGEMKYLKEPTKEEDIEALKKYGPPATMQRD